MFKELKATHKPEVSPKELLKKISDMEEQELNQINLSVPTYLLCPISGWLMDDPTTIESGQTYDRTFIQQFFTLRKAQFDKEKDQDEIDEKTFFKCPTTNQVVDPDLFIPNKTIKAATKKFIDENCWAFDFDPRQKY